MIDRKTLNALDAYFVSGRNLTDGTMPANATDIDSAIHRVGDYKASTTGIVLAVNDAGTLKWLQITGTVAW